MKATCALVLAGLLAGPASVAAVQGTWQIVGNTSLSCVHQAYTFGDRIFCMERPHVYPVSESAAASHVLGFHPADHTIFPLPQYVWNIYATGPNGEVFEGQESTFINSQATSQPLPVPQVPFCSGHSMTQTGGVLVAGGDMPYVVGKNWDGKQSIREYHPAPKTIGQGQQPLGTWSVYANMTTPRWYPTVATLAAGNHIIVGGSYSNPADALLYFPEADQIDQNNPTYEYYPPKTGALWVNGYVNLTLLDDAFPAMLYPLVFQLPSGKVFVFANTFANLIDPVTDTITKLPDLPNEGLDHSPWTYPFTPTAALLPLRPSNNYLATVQICGGTVISIVDSAGLPKAATTCMQISPEAPNGAVWTRVEDLPTGRVMPDVVILPDGGLVYTNGGGMGLSAGDAGTGRCYNPAFQTDIMYPERPAGQRWFPNVATSTISRLYHSGALLRYDGRVFTTGSDQQNYIDKWGTNGTGPVRENCWPVGLDVCTDPFEYRIELFTPPYLIGTTRPVIASAPATIVHGQAFTITTSTDGTLVTKVVIMRHASTTHSTNSDQRLVELQITATTATSVTVVGPPNSRIAVPGSYMLFLLNAAGTPSEATDALVAVTATSYPVGTCSSLVINTFFQNSINNLGGATGDDGTSIGLLATNGRVKFTPQAGTYYYENLGTPYINASPYNFLVIFINANATTPSFTLQVQTGATTAVRQTFPAISVASGVDTLLAINLTAFVTPVSSLAQLRALSLTYNYGTTGVWSMGNLKLVTTLADCGMSSARIVNPTTVAVPTTAPAGSTTSTAAVSTSSSVPGVVTTTSSAVIVQTSSAPAVTTTAAAVPLGVCNQTAINSFTKFGVNALGYSFSDDGSTSKYTVNNGILSFVPIAGSYYYEVLNCFYTATRPYIAFTIQSAGPVSFRVQLQGGCYSDGAQINGPVWSGNPVTATTIVIDAASYLATAPAASSKSLWSLVLASMTGDGTTSWQITNIVALSGLNSGCGFTSASLISYTGVSTWSASAATSTKSTATTSAAVTSTKSSSVAATTTASAAAPCVSTTIDAFTAPYSNALGGEKGDDGSMASYAVSNGQLAFVPKADGSSYLYENVIADGSTAAINAAPNPIFVFTVQSAYAKAAFTVQIQIKANGVVSRYPINIPAFGTAAKTFAISISNIIPATSSINSLWSLAFVNFVSDGATPWYLSNLKLVSSTTACGFAGATVPAGAGTVQRRKRSDEL
ncbi:hypothetical protein HKX48_003745 [Thoreauomyces humboldtii]|nr:hypothetical protein HKX48_003745 [Thoreauomyces humboldtii]